VLGNAEKSSSAHGVLQVPAKVPLYEQNLIAPAPIPPRGAPVVPSIAHEGGWAEIERDERMTTINAKPAIFHNDRGFCLRLDDVVPCTIGSSSNNWLIIGCTST